MSSGAKASTPAGLWLHGSSGRMGQEIKKALSDDPARRFRFVGGSDRNFDGELFHQGRPVSKELLAHVLVRDEVDVIFDFTATDGNAVLLEAIVQGPVRGKALLIGTTGLTAERLAQWRAVAAAHGLRLLIAPNTSVGILVTVKAALLAATALTGLGFDIEITETHHRDKRDAPSGTARFLAETLVAGTAGLTIKTDRHGARQRGELGVHAVRGGGVFGEHEVRLLGDAEEIRISHRAFSRSLFASGALVLAGWLLRQPVGVYGLLDVKAEELTP